MVDVVCLVASNLHVGGGVQVAASVVCELANQSRFAPHLDVLASTEVHENAVEMGLAPERFHRYAVVDVYGMRQMFGAFSHRLRQYDVVFTLFGPLYAWRQPYKSIVGFAQAFVAYPQNEAYLQKTWWTRILVHMKFQIQKLYFQRADCLVVEATHVRERLQAMGWRNEIDVVPNCVADIFRYPDKWAAISLQRTERIKLGIVSRDYPHKNIGVFPQVRELLLRRYGLEAMFYVTFSDAEWQRRDEVFRRNVVNVGPLSVAQCPSFYKQMDGVVFPSLLECFSATPLEAICMGVPLFASDRPFVRDICGDRAVYFEPTSPESIASSIAEFFRAPPQDQPEAVELEPQYLDPALRAERYMNILQKYAGRP